MLVFRYFSKEHTLMMLSRRLAFPDVWLTNPYDYVIQAATKYLRLPS